MLAACDTFRAAAGEQLAVWGARANVPVVSGAPGTDAAGLAFEAVQKAQAENIDVLLVDTAGRLQNNDGLMAELEKIIRVMRKLMPEAPHASLLVLDATVGQNAVRQAEVFLEKAAITGLIVTKLDGTARGGGLVPVAMKLNLPVYFIGVGEQAEDLQTFNAAEFAAALTGADMAQSEKGSMTWQVGAKRRKSSGHCWSFSFSMRAARNGLACPKAKACLSPRAALW